MFAVLIAAEMLYNRNRLERHNTRDTAISLSLGIGAAFITIISQHHLENLWLSIGEMKILDLGFHPIIWIACFILDDLLYHLLHRISHKIRWFWAAHVNHHSSRYFNLTTALRESWTGLLALSFVFKIPLFLIGFPIEMIIFCGGLNLIYQFWLHTEVIHKLPNWFEYVMNTPSHHRVHHGVNPAYIDKNFGGVFIVWDRLFGSFEPENLSDRPVYGIVNDIGKANLFWSAFHEWYEILHDVRRAKDKRSLWLSLFGRPGQFSDVTLDQKHQADRT